MEKFNSTKYKNQYTREKYDRLSVICPKGEKELIEEHYKTKGFKSFSSYVNTLIKADMNTKIQGGGTTEQKSSEA